MNKPMAEFIENRNISHVGAPNAPAPGSAVGE
jgi:hypothetical protein